MRKVKEVLRLRYELGMSYSQIRQSCGVSLGTLNNLLVRAEQAGLTSWDQVRDLGEEALERRLYQRADDGHWLEMRPLPDWGSRQELCVAVRHRRTNRQLDAGSHNLPWDSITSSPRETPDGQRRQSAAISRSFASC